MMLRVNTDRQINLAGKDEMHITGGRVTLPYMYRYRYLPFWKSPHKYPAEANKRKYWYAYRYPYTMKTCSRANPADEV
jgi:hypothetical protein